MDLPVGLEQGAEDDAECAICRAYLHLSAGRGEGGGGTGGKGALLCRVSPPLWLSNACPLALFLHQPVHRVMCARAVECDCCKGRRVCLHHAHNLCGCHMRQRRLVYRRSMRQLEALQAGKRHLLREEQQEQMLEKQWNAVPLLFDVRGCSHPPLATPAAAVAAQVPAEVAAELEAYEAAAAARAAAASEAAAVAAAAVKNGKVAAAPVAVKSEAAGKAAGGGKAGKGDGAAPSDEPRGSAAPVKEEQQEQMALVALAPAAGQDAVQANVSQQSGEP